METPIEQLPRRCPRDDHRVALVLGDLRIDNLIWDPSQPRIIAVIDWELATLGDPLADLDYFRTCRCADRAIRRYPDWTGSTAKLWVSRTIPR